MKWEFGRWLLAGILIAAWSRGAVADTLRGAETPLEALANTAAIVEGSVRGIGYTFDAAAGPRTVATLVEVTTDFGRFGDRTIDVATLGGPIDERHALFIPELPRLTEDTRYLIFLNNVDWFFTPIVGHYLFRIEPGPRGDVLIAPSGQAVMGLSAEAGLVLSEDPVLDTQLDFARPHDKPRLLEGANAVLANALSKENFLIAVRDLLRAVPLQGELRSSPSRERVWNRLPVEESPLRGSTER
jgi:hypothetical protein